MANQEHLEILRQGAKEWNKWIAKKRAEHPQFQPDLYEADLSNTNLYEADLTGARLSRAKLCGANLVEANLSEARLYGTDLSQTKLYNTNFHKAHLYMAKFADADIRFAQHVVLDDCLIENAHFRNKAADPWSILRQKYTGPMLLFHLIFLIVFFGYNTFQALTWKGINILQTEITENQQNLPIEIENYVLQQSAKLSFNNKKTDILAAKIKEKITNRIQSLTPCLKDECDNPRPIWEVLLNLHNAWWNATLTIVLLLYNIFRVGFTWWIGLLRDAEERSNRSPTYASYKWWYRAHRYFMAPILTVAVLSIVINGYDILVSTTVILPIQ